MSAKYLSVLATCSILFGASQAYLIDKGCGEDLAFVRESIDRAFGLATLAVKRLEERPIKPEIEDVFKQLFGTTPGERQSHNEGGPPTIENGLKRLEDISSEIEAVDPRDRTKTEVTFYCTTTRIERRPKGGWFNKDTNYVYVNKDNDGVYEGDMDSFGGCFNLMPPALAITFNPRGRPSEIQICPWFMANLRGVFKYRNFQDVLGDGGNALTLGALSKVGMPLMSKALYAPIDSMTLMDKVLLHELTHTAQYGGGNANVATFDMGQDPKEAGKPYGWKNCKELAKIYIDGGKKPERDPQWNADTVALMCSAIQLIENGIRIDEDGVLHSPPRNGRRDVVMYPVTWVA